MRLAQVEQRYTLMRRELVETLFRAGRPLTIPELLALNPELPQSSAYRTITTLIDAGVVRRVTGADYHGRFELTEDFSEHHHHLVCECCGKVQDVQPSARLEQALAEAARVAAEEQSFQINEHRFDFIGRCAACRDEPSD